MERGGKVQLYAGFSPNELLSKAGWLSTELTVFLKPRGSGQGDKVELCPYLMVNSNV